MSAATWPDKWQTSDRNRHASYWIDLPENQFRERVKPSASRNRIVLDWQGTVATRFGRLQEKLLKDLLPGLNAHPDVLAIVVERRHTRLHFNTMSESINTVMLDEVVKPVNRLINSSSQVSAISDPARAVAVLAVTMRLATNIAAIALSRRNTGHRSSRSLRTI